MLQANALAAALKNDFMVLFANSAAQSGLTADQYADRLAAVIATHVVTHLQANAVVSTTVTGTAGPYPVVASGRGTLS